MHETMGGMSPGERPRQSTRSLPRAPDEGGRVSVLFLTHYARIGAPSRYRIYQFFPTWRDAGIAPTVQVIQDETMCIMRQQRRGTARFAVKAAIAYLRRMAFLLFQGRNYPVWVIEKELFPGLPFWLERLFLPSRVRIAVDYDDAVFLKYDRGSFLKRWLVGGKIGRLMRRADVVLSGNDFISEYARRAGAADVRWIPTVVDQAKYRSGADIGREGPVVIGWMGAYRNSRHLAAIGSALARLAAEQDFLLRIVGGAEVRLPPEVKVEYRPWSEETEVQELRDFTVGIMPLMDGEWEKGKCGLKLIQYLAAGIPVVASPIGINSVIVSPGVNGYTASTEDEWVDALRRILRERVEGAFGPEACASTVMDRFTIAAQGPGLAVILKDLAAPAPARGHRPRPA